MKGSAGGDEGACKATAYKVTKDTEGACSKATHLRRLLAVPEVFDPEHPHELRPNTPAPLTLRRHRARAARAQDGRYTRGTGSGTEAGRWDRAL